MASRFTDINAFVGTLASLGLKLEHKVRARFVGSAPAAATWTHCRPVRSTGPRARATTQDTRNPVFVLFRFRKVGGAPPPVAAKAGSSVQAPALKPCLYKKRPSAADEYDDMAML